MSATAEKLASPLSWVGGKFYAARRIVAAFPPAPSYDAYVEPFGGPPMCSWRASRAATWQAMPAANYRRCGQPGCKAAQRLDQGEWKTVFPNGTKAKAETRQGPSLLEARPTGQREKGASPYEAR